MGAGVVAVPEVASGAGVGAGVGLGTTTGAGGGTSSFLLQAVKATARIAPMTRACLIYFP